MRSKALLANLLLFCLVPTPLLIGQASSGAAGESNTPAGTHAPDPDSGMTNHVDGLFIPLVTGQPFHAKIQVEITRTLPDGTTVAQKYYTLAARDADGHEYRETRDIIPADSDRDPPIIRTVVYDPKTSLITTCTPDQRICRQTNFDPTQHPVDEAAGASSDGKSVLTREDLGTKMMDGLRVTGTRETRTFNPGAFGNDKPVVVTKEIWYSPQLQFNLSVTRLDPRNGNQKLNVVDLKLGDPGQEWFAMADGYRMVQGRGIQTRSMFPTELEPVLEKRVPGMTPDQLSTALQPVEAALGAYAKAHAAASPKDNNDIFAGQERLRLSSDLQILQQGQLPPKVQLTETDLRLNETFRGVINSPCLNKPQPGDPPSMPSNADALRAEQTAWLAMRDAWSGFLAKLFPNTDPASFAWMITNERESDLRRLQNVERNRGCIPEESIEPLLVRFVTGLTSDQLDAAVKPVDAAIHAYAIAHGDSVPNNPNESYERMIDQQLSSQLAMQQRNRVPTQDQFEEADLHLNQAFRAVIASPCLTKPIPGDPPNAPTSEEKLRAEERAWIAMRDAWTAFMTTAFPNANQAAFGTTLTQMRTGELTQIQNIERNRGCPPPE
jgi:uncharacterized protein YecT (DUF1311 family)